MATSRETFSADLDALGAKIADAERARDIESFQSAPPTWTTSDLDALGAKIASEEMAEKGKATETAKPVAGRGYELSAEPVTLGERMTTFYRGTDTEPPAGAKLIPFKGGLGFLGQRSLAKAKERLAKREEYGLLADKSLEDYWGQRGVYNPVQHFQAPREELVQRLAGDLARDDETLVADAEKEATGASERPMTVAAKYVGGGVEMAADIVRTLAELRIAGGLVGRAGLGKMIVGRVVGKLGVKSIPWAMRLARMAETGMTFGTRAAMETAVKGAIEQDLTVEDVKDVAKETAFGTALGTAGGLSRIWARMPAEAALGWGTAKLEGASNEDAALNAALFAAFSLLNRKNMNREYRRAAVGKVENDFVRKMAGFGVEPGQARSRFRGYVYDQAQKITGETSSEAALGKVLENRKLNLKYWGEIEKRVAGMEKVGAKIGGESGLVPRAAQPPPLPPETVAAVPTKPTPPTLPEPTAVEPVAPVVEPPPVAKPVPAAPEGKAAEDVEYDASLEKFRAASKSFRAAEKAYRSKQIGDQEYLAARKVFDVAQAEADVAETKFLEAKNAAVPPAKAKKERKAKAIAATEGMKRPVGMRMTRQQIRLATRKQLVEAMRANTLGPVVGTSNDMRKALLSHMLDHGQLKTLTPEDKAVMRDNFKRNMKSGKEIHQWAADEEASKLADSMLVNAIPPNTEVQLRGSTGFDSWRIAEVLVPSPADVAKNDLSYVIRDDISGEVKTVSGRMLDLVEQTGEVADDARGVAENLRKPEGQMAGEGVIAKAGATEGVGGDQDLAAWKTAHGVADKPEQGEMFGKGAVGDQFRLVQERGEDFQKRLREKESADLAAEQADKAQGRLFAVRPQLPPTAKPAAKAAKPAAITPAPVPAKARAEKLPPAKVAEATPITKAGDTLEQQIERGEKVTKPPSASWVQLTYMNDTVRVDSPGELYAYKGTPIKKAVWGNKNNKGVFLPLSKEELRISKGKVEPAAKESYPVEQEPTPQPMAEPVSTKDVVDTFSKAFGVPIRVGRFRNRASGIYKVDPEVVRTKGYGDIATASHEVAHHLWNTSNIPKVLPLDVKAELRTKDYKPKRASPNEGFAEFMRHLLTKDDATTFAPKAAKWFAESWLPRNPKALKAVQDSKGKVDAWRKQGYINSIIAQIEKPPSRFDDSAKLFKNPRAAWNTVLDTMMDRIGPLRRAQFAIAGTKNLADIPAQFQFAEAAKALNMTAPAKARAVVLTHMIDFMGNRVGKSLQEHMAPVLDQLRNETTATEFLVFLYARHALDVIAQGKEPGITKESAKFAVDQFSQRPGWTEAADGLTAWHDQLLDYVVAAGGLSQEGKATMRAMYPHYVPLMRVMEDAGVLGGGGKKLADLPNVIHHLKGSGRKIYSPLESSIIYAERLIGLADKIRVGKMLYDASEHYGGTGEFLEEVSPKMLRKTVDLQRIKGDLQKAGVDLSLADMDATITIFENLYRGDRKDNIISLYIDGKPKLFQVSPDIYRAMTGMTNLYQLPPVLEWLLAKPARLKRLTTTGLQPGFSLVTNPLRDVMTSIMQTRTGLVRGSLPAKVYDNILAAFDQFTNDEVAQLWAAGGGELAQPLGLDRIFTRHLLDEMLARTPTEKILNWSKHPVDTMRQLFSLPEAAPRIAEFTRVIKSLGWKPGQPLTIEQWLAGQIAAADVTVDFRQGGTFSMWLNRMVAFHNVSLQDPLQVVRAFKRHPGKTMLSGLLWITIPTLLLWLKNKDEPWYQELSPWERWGYFHIKTPNGVVIRLPKPFLWGVLFSSIPEAIVDHVYTQNDQTVREMIEQSLRSIAPPIIPTTAIGTTEVAYGKGGWDFFRGRQIESQELQQLPTAERAYQSTTQLARHLGKLFNVSPVKIEHLIQSYAASIPIDAVRTVEQFGKKKPERPTELADLPVVGRLFLRSTSTGTIDRFYKNMESIDQIAKSRKVAGLNYAIARNVGSVMDTKARRLGDIREEVRRVTKDDAMSLSKKTATLLALHNQMLRVAREGIALSKSAIQKYERR